MAPLLRLLESGTFRLGILRQLRGISSKEWGAGVMGFFFRAAPPVCWAVPTTDYACVLHRESIFHSLAASRQVYLRYLYSPIACEMAQDAAQLTQRVVALIRENAHGTKIRADAMSNVELWLGHRPRNAQRVLLAISIVHLQSSRITLGFAAFPHAIRHPRAEASGAESRPESWKWAARQNRD